MSNVSILKIYLSIPIRHQEYSYDIENCLKSYNVEVLNPCNIVPSGCSPADIPRAIANSCWQMIDESLAIILFADYYGRDCAAEVGYAIAQKKPIFPIYFQTDLSTLDRDWSIKHFTEDSSFGLKMLVENLQKKFPSFFENHDKLIS